MPSKLSRVLSLLFTLALGPLGAALADAQVRSAPLAPAPEPLAKAVTLPEEPPARIAAGFGVEPLASLMNARTGAAEKVESLAARNRQERVPLQNGIVRPLPLTREVRFGDGLEKAAGLHAGGAFVRLGRDATVWGASVQVADAYRLRLHLEDVDLPAGTRLWVYGDGGESVAFGPELAHDGSLWTPSVEGSTIHLEVELPASGMTEPGFRLGQVAELFVLDDTGAPVLGGVATKGPACLVDVSCVAPATFPVVSQASKAVAQMEFVSGLGAFVCTGGLLNLADGAPAGLEPPFLTANHCISNQAEAASLEAYWDFRSSTCDGTPPLRTDSPRTNGSTLLVTSEETDFTLLGLSSIPSGRILLGWDATVPVQPQNTVLHRISHPFFGSLLAQRYTRYRVKGAGEMIMCSLAPGDPPANDLEKFHHTVFLEGGTFGGSSGAPLITGNGQVVGQLLGACGPNTADGCSVDNDELDGNFYSSFDSAAPYLGVVGPSEWHTTPEIPGFEFQVVISPPGIPPVDGTPESRCIVETFCASGALPGRPEVFVKLIGPRPNGYLWVQISRFTPSVVEVWVRQTATETTRYYRLDAVGALADDVPGHQDRQAFMP